MTISPFLQHCQIINYRPTECENKELTKLLRNGVYKTLLNSFYTPNKLVKVSLIKYLSLKLKEFNNFDTF